MAPEDVDQAEEQNGSINIAAIDHETLHGPSLVFLGIFKTNYQYPGPLYGEGTFLPLFTNRS